MKNSNKTLLTGLGVLAITATLVSFNSDKKKKYEIIHHVNGKTITYDTVIPMNSNYTVEAFLADKGIKSENVEIIKVPNNHSKMMFIEKKCEKTNSDGGNTDENVEINVEMDENGNKTITKKVNGQEVELTPEELAEIEENMSNAGGEIKIIEIEEGDDFEFQGDLPEGSEMVEIRAEIDDKGNLVAKKFVNGETVEMTTEELEQLKSHESGHNKIIEIRGEDSGKEQKMLISKTISIEETTDGKKSNKTESHEVNWTSDNPNEEFTLVLVTEDVEEKSASSKNRTEIKDDKGAFSIYPNPNNGHFTLLLEQSEKAKTTIHITDGQGKVVFEEDLGKFSGSYSKQIDLRKFGAGVYMIAVEQGNNKNVQKIIVQE